ncbi:M1 family peptidase [Skermanella rosea]|uniref:M1 family metallopeptidase n=1 Tax=Skermanella rosea TaxID=1817965 RepID=UPI0019347735|nr:M1 family aminopeptidase [Skermanella rosea]UEM05278.1 M1 family peptidase [Skermanella rosea]
MKSGLAAIGAIFWLTLASPCLAASAAEVTHDAAIDLDPAARRLEVTDQVTVTGGAPLEFHLSPRFSPVRLEIDGRPADAVGGPTRWRVPAAGAGAGRVTIRYSGTLAPLDDSGSPFGGDEPGSGEAGSFLPGGTGWLPRFDADRTTYRLAVRVPEGYRAAVTGDLAEETDEEAVFTIDPAVEEPSLFAGRWQVRERMAGGLRLRTLFEPDLEHLSDDYLQASETYIAHFSERIGPYPFSGFSILSAPLPVGLGFAGLTYIGRQVLPLPFMRGQSLPHEILHNWWGNGVLVDYASGNWSEGLTTYMADYGLTAERDPDAAREMRFGWLRDYAALPDARDGSLADFTARVHGAAKIVGYNKSAYLFLMLRDMLGDEAFDRGIRLFWERHRFRKAGWSDLRAAFEAASGRDLGGFFDQWVTRTGAPALRLMEASATRLGDRYALAVRIGQGEPAYRLDVPMVVETTDGQVRRTIPLAGSEAAATIDLDAPPLSVAVDPEYRLFRRLAPGEAAPILRDVTLNPATRLVLAGPHQDLGRTLASRLMDAGAAAGEPLGGAPVAVIGITADVYKALPRLGLAPVPDGLAGQGTARVWTGRTAGGAPALVVAADDRAALEALLRPLPHYGRQSYLVFQGREAVERGIWPPGDNPLKRTVAVE